jgi:hypothetical protein
MRLYIKSALSLKQTANLVGSIALPEFTGQLRDGLNLGGGDYFRFTSKDADLLLVCNDADHAEVFVPLRSDWLYYCYQRKGAEQLLVTMLETLRAHGFTCELADDME